MESYWTLFLKRTCAGGPCLHAHQYDFVAAAEDGDGGDGDVVAVVGHDVLVALVADTCLPYSFA